MIKRKAKNVIQFAEILAEYDIEKFDIEIAEFPCVLCIEQSGDEYNLVSYVSMSDFEEPDFISAIQRILDWHQQFAEMEFPAGGLQILMQARAKLARFNEDLGRYKSELETIKLETEYKRRRIKDTLLLKYRKDGMTISEAQAQARVDSETYDNLHVEATRDYKDVCALYDTVNQTLNAMAGERSHLEQEYKYSAIREGANV